MQVVTDVEARANNRVNEALSSVLESEVKTQCIIKSVVHSSNRHSQLPYSVTSHD
jgi:hypothetical protein